MQAAVHELLQAGRVVTGEEVARLEQVLCARVGRRCALAVDSGTSAITLALRLLARDRERASLRVGIPAFGCASLLVAVVAAGMTPWPLDCDPDSLTLTDSALRAGLDLVVVVHPFGMVEPMIEADWGIPVIEDIAQSADGAWRAVALGGRGRVTIASFHATKPWGGAYGGALLLDDEREEVAVRRMCDPDGATEGGVAVGHHLLSDLHALLARQRLAESEALMARRKQQAVRMRAWLQQVDAQLCSAPVGNHFRLLAASHRYPAALLRQRLQAAGVAAELPVKQPLSKWVGVDAPGADTAFRRWVSLPLLADLTDDEAAIMELAIHKAFSG